MPETPDRPSAAGRLALVFVSPRAAFRGLDAKPSIAAPFAALLIAGGAWTLLVRGRSSPPIGLELAVVALLFAAGSLVAATVLHGLVRRAGSTIPFAATLSIVLLDSVPAVVVSMLVAAAFFLASPHGVADDCFRAAKTSLAAWLPGGTPHAALQAARAIDLLQVWTAALSVAGLESAAGLGRRKAVQVTLLHQGMILLGRLACFLPAMLQR